METDTQQEEPRPPAINTELAQALHQTPSNDVSNGITIDSASPPLSSGLTTPNAKMSAPRRPSHPATSPLNPSSPRPQSAVRRTSSAMGLNERPTSSPNGLKKKSSRSSLGGPVEENDRRPTPKRSISNLITGLREAQTKMESIEEPIPLTAPQIAIEHFTRELLSHAQPHSKAETMVILHDACYGHRYSRLKTTKTTLSMIVERPERIHASVLGASTAYVRLGGHHSGGANAPHPDTTTPTTPPFKIRRTGRSMDITSPCVTNVHGTAWMAELRTMCNAAGEKLAAGAKELSRPSTPNEPEKRKLHEGDLYLSTESLNAFQGTLGGVADAVDAVFDRESETKRAFVAVRPPGHHCSADHPSGFCWLNNVHVGIEYAALTYGLTHAAILDFDLHHGDGSQAITWERNSKNNLKRWNAKPNSKLKLGPDIGYYSLHDINSYPCEMGDDEKVQAASLCIDNAHGQSIWNVHLQSWKTEDEFWELYETKYRVLLEKARLFLRHHTARLKVDGKVQPKAAIFISAGFDASEWESAGMQRHKVNVPTEFYARFTRDVVELAQEEGLGCDGKVISVLEGGYSDRALCSGVLSHLSGLCGTPMATIKKEDSDIGDLDRAMSGLGINGMDNGHAFHYNKSWWSSSNLTALEQKINPPPLAQAKKMRVGQQPTYATPTESFAYKVIDANKFARSISGTMREVQRPARPPTPPPPEVEWVVATQELSKMLIPSHRQTRSCTPEELAGVKVKKETTTAKPQVISMEDAAKPRQLRDRKTKGPAYPESAHSDELESVRSVSRSSRRQTIAELPSSSSQPEPTHQRRASRRLSAGSTLSSIGGDLDSRPPPVPAVPAGRPVSNRAMEPPSVSATGVQVKKTRAPVKSKQDGSSAPSSPRTIKPSARLSGPSSNLAEAPSTSSTNDVDALTSGMKKVSLKVGSKEDHDRKQKERIDAERRARALKAAETRKANAAAKKAAIEVNGVTTKPAVKHPAPQTKENTAPLNYTSDTNLAGQAAVDWMAQGPITGQHPNATSTSYSIPPTTFDPSTVPTTHDTPLMPTVQDQYQSNQAAMAASNVPQQYQSVNDFNSSSAGAPIYHDLQPPIATNVLQHPVQSNPWLTDTVAPSTKSMPNSRPSSAHQLPVWSSTGPIPFGMSNRNDTVTPSNPNSWGQNTSGLSFASNYAGAGPLLNNAEGPAVDGASEQRKEGSIWDVPATPGP